MNTGSHLWYPAPRIFFVSKVTLRFGYDQILSSSIYFRLCGFPSTQSYAGLREGVQTPSPLVIEVTGFCIQHMARTASQVIILSFRFLFGYSLTQCHIFLQCAHWFFFNLGCSLELGCSPWSLDRYFSWHFFSSESLEVVVRSILATFQVCFVLSEARTLICFSPGFLAVVHFLSYCSEYSSDAVICKPI